MSGTQETLLWIGAAGMALGAVAIALLGRGSRADDRHHFVASFFVCALAACAYFAMANGQGVTEIGDRTVYYARYLDWLLTTPLLLLGLVLVGLPRSSAEEGRERNGLIASILGADVLMIVTGLLATLSTSDGVRYAWYAISCVAFLGVLALIYGPVMRGAQAQPQRRGGPVPLADAHPHGPVVRLPGAVVARHGGRRRAVADGRDRYLRGRGPGGKGRLRPPARHRGDAPVAQPVGGQAADPDGAGRLSAMARAPIVILGAGLAGLSLARALLRECPDRRLVLVDRRTAWERDRTWCFWATPGEPWGEHATARWHAWRTVGPAGAATQRSERHPYLHVPADAFYASTLDALEAAGVEIVSGTRVLGVRASAGGVHVETSAGEIEGAFAVDAMGGRGPLLRGRPPGALELSQRFTGLEVEVQRPVFDPSVATIMDFRMPAVEGSVRFAYVLPFSRTRALVEDTSIGGPPIAAEERRAAVRSYLDGVLHAGDATVLREEHGVLPMTSFAFPVARGPRIYAVGQAAGAARASSGYAFVRTQRHARALARSIAREQPAPPVDSARRRKLDLLFLRALQAEPELAPGWFSALAERVDGDAFARFMSDASGLADEWRVIRAVASKEFVAAMGADTGARERRRAVQRPVERPAAA